MEKRLTLAEVREVVKKEVDKLEGKVLSPKEDSFRTNFYAFCQEVLLEPEFGEVAIRKILKDGIQIGNPETGYNLIAK